MSAVVKVAAVVIALAAIVVVLIAAAVLARVGDDDEASRTIQVTGSGFVLVAPDHATVTATAEARDADASDALQQANERMQRVLAAVRDAGVAEDQLTTSGVQTRRERRHPPEPSAEPGDWIATISLRIELDDLDLVGEVLAAANEAGAQQVEGPNYSVRDREGAHAEALAMAMDEARAKADTIAEQSDASVDELVSATDGDGPRAYEASRTGVAASAGSADAIAVTSGATQRIEATATATYAIDDD